MVQHSITLPFEYSVFVELVVFGAIFLSHKVVYGKQIAVRAHSNRSSAISLRVPVTLTYNKSQYR